MRQLYTKQVAHAAVLAKALETYGAALDASSTGCGKTLVAAELAAGYRRPTLVVCLKNSIPMWEAEMRDRGWPALGVINYDMLRTGRTEWGSWVPGSRIFQFTLPPDALIIWDEVQKCQGLDTKNSKTLIATKPFWNLLLSATAVENPSEMRALGYILGLHNLRSFVPWCKAHGCKLNQWRGWDFNDHDGKIMNALHHEIFPLHGSRLRVADLAEHFQETQIITTPLEFGKEIHTIYEEMETELAALAETIAGDRKNVSAARLVARLRGRQRAELCKVPTMVEMAEDLIKEGRSVVIFVNFNATVEALLGRFQCHVETIRGGQSTEDRTRIMADFQADRTRLLICNTQAGGVSISLHDQHGKHPRTAIISPSDNAKDILQVLGRVHRAGGATHSQQHVLFASGTVEVVVEQNCREKIVNMDIFNDGKTIDAPAPISEDEPVTEHARYNPSSLAMWEKCPGFMNRAGTNAIAEMGTRGHKALETDAIHTLPEPERPVAQLCQDFIDAILQERGVPDQDRREVRLSIDLDGDITTFGTCDRLLTYGTHGEMLDFKFGRLSVADAEMNTQAWAYVIGAFQLEPALQTITFTFLIPNQDIVSSHTFNRSDLPAMKLRLNTIIRRAMEVGADLSGNFSLLNPQPELCEYCAQQSRCPAIAARALKVAQSTGLPVPGELVVSADRPEDIAHLLRLAPILENLAASWKADALRVNLEDGIDVPGFIRQERRTPRSITSVAGAWDIAKTHGVVLEDFLLSCTGISMVELENAVAAGVAKGKGKAKQKLESDLRAADLLREQTNYHYLRENKK